jgi:hypothetical protein
LNAKECNMAEPDAANAAPAVTPLATDPETGFAMMGDLPVNGRLRAEALARSGATTDERGIVSDELIAATKDRLEREDAEAERLAEEARKAEAQRPAVSTRLSLDKLKEIAAGENVAVGENPDKSTLVDAIEAARAANTTEA